MKARIKNSISCFLFAVALSTMLISECGCSLFYPEPTHDPLAGFHVDTMYTPSGYKAIIDDCKNYIQTLSPEERKNPNLDFYEDETGQHAVKIQIGVYGKVWLHILLYDKENKRIKTIKYPIGSYAS